MPKRLEFQVTGPTEFTLRREDERLVKTKLPKIQNSAGFRISSVLLQKDMSRYHGGAIVIGTSICCDAYTFLYALDGEGPILKSGLSQIYRTTNVRDILPLQVQESGDLDLLVMGDGCHYCGAQILRYGKTIDLIDMNHLLPLTGQGRFEGIAIEPNSDTGEIKLIGDGSLDFDRMPIDGGLEMNGYSPKKVVQLAKKFNRIKLDKDWPRARAILKI